MKRIFSISKPWRPIAWVIIGTQVPAIMCMLFDKHLSVLYGNFVRGLLFLAVVVTIWKVIKANIVFRCKWQNVVFAGLAGTVWAATELYFVPVGGIPRLHGVIETFIATIYLVIIYPFGEELLFRGLVISGFSDKSQLFKIIVSSMLFLLVHLAFGISLFTFVEFAVIGFVFGWIAVKSGSVLPSMVMHSAFNAVMLCVFIATRFNSLRLH